MKLTRRGVMGTAAGAVAAATMEKQQIAQMPQAGVGGSPGYTPDWPNISEPQAPSLSYWREVKEKAEKILKGDFSGVRFGATIHNTASLDDLKSPSLAGKRMIAQGRYIENQKEHYIEEAKHELEMALKALGLKL